MALEDLARHGPRALLKGQIPRHRARAASRAALGFLLVPESFESCRGGLRFTLQLSRQHQPLRSDRIVPGTRTLFPDPRRPGAPGRTGKPPGRGVTSPSWRRSRMHWWNPPGGPTPTDMEDRAQRQPLGEPLISRENFQITRDDEEHAPETGSGGSAVLKNAPNGLLPRENTAREIEFINRLVRNAPAIVRRLRTGPSSRRRCPVSISPRELAGDADGRPLPPPLRGVSGKTARELLPSVG